MGFKVGLGILLYAGLAAAQTDTVGVPDYTVDHAECALFGPNYDRYVAKARNGSGTTPHQAQMSALTNAIAAKASGTNTL